MLIKNKQREFGFFTLTQGMIPHELSDRHICLEILVCGKSLFFGFCCG
jgi:hypothetical protein